MKTIINIAFNSALNGARTSAERQKSVRPSVLLVSLACALVSLGCGSNEALLEDGHNCGATSYTAFDAANHAAQDQRIAAQESMAALADEAAQNLADAPAKFAAIEDLYLNTADLKLKVEGRADDHYPDDPAAASVGKQIDQDIMNAIARGKAAQSALEVKIAQHIIDKRLTHFFYLSVYHELIEGTRGTYDEAFGYLGTGPKNDPQGLLSIAKIAAKRDAESGTTLESELFDEIIEGSCALDLRLLKDGVDTIDWKSDADYAHEVEEIDERMGKVLALSVAHEFFTPLSSLDAEEATVLLYEGAYYFAAIEAAMKAMGGAAADDAAEIRKRLDAAMASVDAADPSWQATFDSDFIRDRVAAAFAVTPKG